MHTTDDSGLIVRVADMAEGLKGFEALDPDLELSEVKAINEARDARLLQLLVDRPDLYEARRAYILKEDTPS
jgi:hypothetical protein